MHHEGNYKSSKFKNNLPRFQQLLEWLATTDAPAPHICMEATGCYGEALSTFLVGNGFTVSVANPIRIKGFAESVMARSKIDKLNAKVIVRFFQAL